MRKLLIAFVLSLVSTAALAQNTTCSDRSASDSSNACANTRFVQKHTVLPGNISLNNGQIIIGNASNVGQGQTMSGDCTITNAGVITCAGSTTQFITVANINSLQAVNTAMYLGSYVRDPKTGGTFYWNSSDISSTLILSSATSTAVNSGTGVVTANGHGFSTGDTVLSTSSVNGLLLNTYYYIIRVDANNYKLASSFANALAGTNITLTGTTNFTATKLRDPMQMVYVIPTALAKNGSQGAWIRQINYLSGYSPLWGNAACDAATDDYQVFFSMINLVDNNSLWKFPLGLCGISKTLNIAKAISMEGVSKIASGLYALGFSTDVSILNYQGTSGANISNIHWDNMALWSDNNLARGMTLVWTTKYHANNMYFYNLYRGAYLDTSYNGLWSNISQYNTATDTFYLYTEDNNIHFDRVEYGGLNGIQIVGNMSDIEFTGGNFEGITSASGCGINIAPVTGTSVTGVVIRGYSESNIGTFLCVGGADANSVVGLDVSHTYINGTGTNAIVLTNAIGFSIDGATFYGWSNAIFRNGTEINGTVKNNTLLTNMTLSNASNTFSSTTETYNNFNRSTGLYIGRRILWLGSVPSVGTFTQGDFVWNTVPSIDPNNLILLGWSRLTTGSGNVVGTDWGRVYVKQNSP